MKARAPAWREFRIGLVLDAAKGRAAVFRQAREASGGWRDVPVARETNTQMENAILARARELRIAQNASR